jgi:hypothetical protein
VKNAFPYALECLAPPNDAIKLLWAPSEEGAHDALFWRSDATSCATEGCELTHMIDEN